MAALGFWRSQYYTAGTGETTTGASVAVARVAVGLRMMYVTKYPTHLIVKGSKRK